MTISEIKQRTQETAPYYFVPKLYDFDNLGPTAKNNAVTKESEKFKEYFLSNTEISDSDKIEAIKRINAYGMKFDSKGNYISIL